MQGVVADFIEQGHFTAHVRRMRTLYRARRDVFAETVHRHLRSEIEFPTAEAGLRATGLFTSDRDDREVTQRAARLGIETAALSGYFVGKPERTGLVLGYAALSPDAIRSGVKTLARAL